SSPIGSARFCTVLSRQAISCANVRRLGRYPRQWLAVGRTEGAALSPTSNIVGVDRILVAQYQQPAGDDRMTPRREIALLRNREAAVLPVGGRRRLGQANHAVLAIQVETVVRINEGTLADAPVPPHHGSR